MILFFRGGSETVTLYIDRKKKIADISSSKTGYKKKHIEWKELFDKGKEKEQEEITNNLNDKMFVKAIEMGMNKVGYRLIYSKCWN